MWNLAGIDLGTQAWFQSNWHPWLDRFLGDITALGGTPVLSLVTIGALLLLLLQGRRDAAVRLLTSILLAKVCCDGIKSLVARARPEFSHPLVLTLPPLNLSFPSGHAMMSTVIYGSIVILAEQYSGLTRGRHFVRMYAGLVVGFIGISRMYLGVHYLSDVLVGWLLGFLWLVATNQYLRKETASGAGIDSVRRVKT